MSMKLTKHQKELTTFGYIQQNSQHEVPFAINKLCLAYYDPIFYIQIRGNPLKQFLKMKTSQSLIKSFKYNKEITFQCEIFPNGRIEGETGYTSLYISAIYDTNLISDVMYEFDIKCNETNSHYRKRKYGNHDAFGWSKGCMKLCDCINLNKLSFEIYVNIDYIKYKSKQKQNWLNRIQIPIHSTYKCIISENILKKIKSYNCGQGYVSDKFGNNCWSIMIYPNGECLKNKGDTIIYITLLKQPININIMCFNWNMTTNKGTNTKYDNDFIDNQCHSLYETYIIHDVFFDDNGPVEIDIDIKLNQMQNHNYDSVAIPNDDFICHDTN